MNKINKFLSDENNAIRTAILVGIVMLIELGLMITFRVMDHRLVLGIITFAFISGLFFELTLLFAWDTYLEFYTPGDNVKEELSEFWKDIKDKFKDWIEYFDWDDLGDIFKVIIFTVIFWGLLSIGYAGWVGFILVCIHVLIIIAGFFVALFNHDFS